MRRMAGFLCVLSCARAPFLEDGSQCATQEKVVLIDVANPYCDTAQARFLKDLVDATPEDPEEAARLYREGFAIAHDLALFEDPFYQWDGRKISTIYERSFGYNPTPEMLLTLGFSYWESEHQKAKETFEAYLCFYPEAPYQERVKETSQKFKDNFCNSVEGPKKAESGCPEEGPGFKDMLYSPPVLIRPFGYTPY